MMPGCSLWLRINLRRATVLAQHEHGGFVQQTPLIEVVHEGREGLIEDRQQVVLQSRVVIRVRVPATAAEDLEGIPEDRDKPRARLDESSRGQARLTEERHAVALAHGLRFKVHIECFADFCCRSAASTPLAVGLYLILAGTDNDYSVTQNSSGTQFDVYFRFSDADPYAGSIACPIGSTVDCSFTTGGLAATLTPAYQLLSGVLHAYTARIDGFVSVPEPGSLVLALSALLMAGAAVRRR